MREAGVAHEKIKVFGFPVTPRFASASTVREDPSSQNLPRVLLMINFGRKEAPALLRKLLALPDVRFTVTVGRDTALHTDILEVAREMKREVEVYGWTDKMPDLLMSHHLVISKAGGATVQETTAARTPLLISQVVPGQEEGNAQLIVENDCGRVATTHDEIVAAVKQAFADDALLWKKWNANLAKLSRPAAALEISEFLLSETRALANPGRD